MGVLGKQLIVIALYTNSVYMSKLLIGSMVAKGVWRLYRLDIPENEDEIRDLSEETVILAAVKINVFGFNIDKQEKYEALYDRATQIWDEYPESAIGQYTVRSFWTAKESPKSDLANVIHDKEHFKKQQLEYFEKVSNRRKDKLSERIDQYETHEDVPNGIPDLLLEFFDRRDGSGGEGTSIEIK